MKNSFVILCDATGAVLRSQGPEQVALVDRVDDQCAWLVESEGLVCEANGASVKAQRCGQDRYEVHPRDHQKSIEVFVRSSLPQHPSSYLKELDEQGFTVVPDVMSESARERFKVQAARVRLREHAEEPPTDGYFWMREGLIWSEDLARASTHPLVLTLLRQYLATQDIHYCHLPVITTLKPADELLGTFPEKGWHSDYPYHPGVFPRDEWPDQPALGAQFNICVDPFEPATAATQFVPGSHTLGHGPDAEFNVGGTQMGVGQHAHVKQMLAPAGAALLYDARTWHRACHELNTSGRDRIAILNAVAPAWVRPMMDKDRHNATFDQTAVAASINRREREEIGRLCLNSLHQTPPGMPILQAKPPPEIRRA